MNSILDQPLVSPEVNSSRKLDAGIDRFWRQADQTLASILQECMGKSWWYGVAGVRCFLYSASFVEIGSICPG